MAKKDKNKMLIVFLYFLSLLIFQIVIGIGQFDGEIKKVVEGHYNFFAVSASFAKAGFLHFVFVSCIAIYVKFSKKIDSEYKNIIRYFPLCTIIFASPISTLATIIVRNYIYFLDVIR